MANSCSGTFRMASSGVVPYAPLARLTRGVKSKGTEYIDLARIRVEMVAFRRVEQVLSSLARETKVSLASCRKQPVLNAQLHFLWCLGINR